VRFNAPQRLQKRSRQSSPREPKTSAQRFNSQRLAIDFDNEVALIYSTYSELLQRHNMTENDADQLRALAALRGEIDDVNVQLPWLSSVELLVLDGFFDFTPIQGEILRELIPRIPKTLVNLNYDTRNPAIFAPFKETLEQLSSIAPFETRETTDARETNGALANLRERLFNTSDKLPCIETSLTPTLEDRIDSEVTANKEDDKLKLIGHSGIRYFECSDRDTEIRAIAKEVKRLVLLEHYQLSDIALVVRQRDAYAKTILRVMGEEGIGSKLESRIDVADVPATRAALKLLELLEQPLTTETPAFRVSDIADLIKTEYFRLSDDELDKLSAQFDSNYLSLIEDENGDIERSKTRYRIGFWDADALENAVAYVGSELPVSAWLARAQKLIKELPGATATKELLNIDAGAPDRDADIADQVENAETAQLDEKVEKKRRPSRDIHPAALAWTSLVIQRFSELIFAVPREGSPNELRLGLMRILDQFGFRDQITKPTRVSTDTSELTQVMLNFNSLESLRRALLAAIKSIEMSMSDKLQFVATSSTPTFEDPPDKLKLIGHCSLQTFISEVRRSLNSQSQLVGPADRGGLRILEAT
jgi:hypothetical protein